MLVLSWNQQQLSLSFLRKLRAIRYCALNADVQKRTTHPNSALSEINANFPTPGERAASFIFPRCIRLLLSYAFDKEPEDCVDRSFRRAKRAECDRSEVNFGFRIGDLFLGRQTGI